MTRGAIRLSDLSASKGTAGAVAVRFACGRCVPKVDNYKSNVGGHIFVSYGYGKVMVHLARENSRGTEHWAALGQRQGWKNPHGSNAVYVCKLNGNIAQVTFDTSVAKAQARCR